MSENDNEMEKKLAKENDILNCLKARMSGINITNANEYISEIEVIILI